ncbi:hypothetical protein CERZMDRAFT_94424 [Cercospora zeae-maydis SCOH1-5]|uniref:SP-RING-type domain-containing protein n=1 Tax=Cercospora zeae-maydis SCOH1-5 TaxID=717836 RepID=A0A6A6FRD5_9PEZI|nr:hypothetical protein CERZMDRAFT_94424 [Cercospora zeae-maydis SCOH1-5]
MIAPGEPPAKRTRLEGPTHYGAGQQDRWTSKRLDTSVRSPPAAPAARGSQSTSSVAQVPQNLRQTSPPVIINLDDDHEDQETQRVPARHTNLSEAGAPGSHTQAGQARQNSVSELVQYELPSTMVDYEPAPPSVQLPGRKSMDGTTRPAPSLPSPAPSDDNTNSPTFVENQVNTSRNRQLSGQQRWSTDSNLVASMRPPLTMQLPGLPRHQVFQPPVGPNSSPLPRIEPPPVQTAQSPQSMPSTEQPLSSTQLPPQFPNLHQRRIIQGHLQKPSGPTLLSNAPPLASTGHGHHQHFRHVNQVPAASRIPKETLLARLNDKDAELRAGLSDTDHGRIALMSSAVSKEDWFYQVLSQLFCLRSVMPSLLPKSLKDVPPSSWDALSGLLVSNDSVNKDLLAFFADFPEPIMEIYSDAVQIREVYERRVQSVKAFLIALPQHWPPMLNAGIRTKVPPLVEDMVDALRLQSPVLQTTCFRAIARRLLGHHNPGTEAMIRLHEFDQHASRYIAQGWRRTEREKNDARSAFQSLYTLWKSHQEQCEQLGDSSGTALPFSTPSDIEVVFRMMAPSLASRIQIPHSQQPVQQQQQQRQQTLPMHQQPHNHILPPPLQRPPSSQVWVQPQHQVNMPTRSPVLASYSGQPLLQSPMSVCQTNRASHVPSHCIPSNSACRPGKAGPAKMRAFPTIGETPRPQPTHPDTNRSALHQAYLRSPVLVASDPNVDASKLFRYVVGYPLPPATIRKSVPVQVATFELSDLAFGRIPKTVASEIPGAPRVRDINEDSVLYRVRCCAVPPSGYQTESSWIVADNTWPEELFLELNGVQLDCRRKLHHGRYLPIDVTSHVVSGENKLKILINRLATDKRRWEFAVAVEEIGITSYNSIKQNLARLSAPDSLAHIKKALSGSDEDADDEIAVTSSNMTIRMVEPWSQTRFVDTPVRSVNCLHKDVFDLDVFLSVCKRLQPDGPAIVDCWRCPLCRGDSRPQTLIMDEFLANVRAELDMRGALDTKAIIVDADGSWKPKIEERTGVRSSSLDREEGSRRPSAAPPKQVEVIELD